MSVARQTIRKKAADLTYDAPLIVSVVALVAFGLMMVFSATWDISYFKYDSATKMFLSQVTSLGVGILALIFFAWLPRSWWRGFVILMLLVTLLALLYVLARGGPKFGSVRGALPGRFMPSELAKLTIVFYLAVWLSSRGDRLRDWSYGMVPFAMIVGLVTGLILMQPDVSAAFTVVIVAVTLFFLAGADLRQMFASLLVGGTVGYLVVNSSETARTRLIEYGQGLSDLTRASWHVQQAIVAFVDGGWFGRGLGESRQKFGALPAPHTDSIFAIVGEELGVAGCLLLMGLFVLLVWRGVKISARAKDPLGALLAAGLVLWLADEALLNIAVIVGLVPFAGNALPFISFGGSSLVVSLSAIGLLLNVSRTAAAETESVPRKTVANYDFSRWNWRRRVSRAGRRKRTG